MYDANTQIHSLLKSRGLPLTSENVRRVLQSNADNPGSEIANLVNQEPPPPDNIQMPSRVGGGAQRHQSLPTPPIPPDQAMSMRGGIGSDPSAHNEMATDPTATNSKLTDAILGSLPLVVVADWLAKRTGQEFAGNKPPGFTGREYIVNPTAISGSGNQATMIEGPQGSRPQITSSPRPNPISIMLDKALGVTDQRGVITLPDQSGVIPLPDQSVQQAPSRPPQTQLSGMDAWDAENAAVQEEMKNSKPQPSDSKRAKKAKKGYQLSEELRALLKGAGKRK